jgi:hypothetical protein
MQIFFGPFDLIYEKFDCIEKRTFRFQVEFIETFLNWSKILQN